jgi:F-box and leucine-rich repeat protein GRR1
MTRVLRSDDPSLPYASSLRRLGLSAIASDLTDELIDGLELCRRIEKLTLTGATNLTTQGIKKLVSGLPELTTADLAAVSGVEDTVVTTIAETTPRLQGLNMTKCISVGDEGLKSIAKHSNLFRRVSRITYYSLADATLIGTFS